MINKVIVDLQEEYECTKITASPDWELLCESHPEPQQCNEMN
jgi:hypothetical protein